MHGGKAPLVGACAHPVRIAQNRPESRVEITRAVSLDSRPLRRTSPFRRARRRAEESLVPSRRRWRRRARPEFEDGLEAEVLLDRPDQQARRPHRLRRIRAGQVVLIAGQHVPRSPDEAAVRSTPRLWTETSVGGPPLGVPDKYEATGVTAVARPSLSGATAYERASASPTPSRGSEVAADGAASGISELRSSPLDAGRRRSRVSGAVDIETLPFRNAREGDVNG